MLYLIYYLGCRSSINKDGTMEDCRIATPTTPISPAGPTASDLRLSKLLEETLASFSMFESDEGMQARYLSCIQYFILYFCKKVDYL